MMIMGTRAETDWMIEAMAVAGCCEGCPVRDLCKKTEKREEAEGVPMDDRTSCGELLRSAICVVATDPPKKRNRPRHHRRRKTKKC